MNRKEKLALAKEAGFAMIWVQGKGEEMTQEVCGSGKQQTEKVLRLIDLAFEAGAAAERDVRRHDVKRVIGDW